MRENVVALEVRSRRFLLELPDVFKQVAKALTLAGEIREDSFQPLGVNSLCGKALRSPAVYRRSPGCVPVVRQSKATARMTGVMRTRSSFARSGTAG